MSQSQKNLCHQFHRKWEIFGTYLCCPEVLGVKCGIPAGFLGRPGIGVGCARPKMGLNRGKPSRNLQMAAFCSIFMSSIRDTLRRTSYAVRYAGVRRNVRKTTKTNYFLIPTENMTTPGGLCYRDWSILSFLGRIGAKMVTVT